MACELCGKPLTGGVRVKLEGSIVTACRGCATLGETIDEPRQEAPKRQAEPKPKKKPERRAEPEYDVVEDSGSLVRRAREKSGLTQEELGKAVNEPHSLIHRIESGKLEPSLMVARKLEKKLKITLLKVQEEGDEVAPEKDKQELTLGDMVVVRKKS